MRTAEKVSNMVDYVKLWDIFSGQCLEEADFAHECVPVKFPKLKERNRNMDESYVDFSDLVGAG